LKIAKELNLAHNQVIRFTRELSFMIASLFVVLSSFKKNIVNSKHGHQANLSLGSHSFDLVRPIISNLDDNQTLVEKIFNINGMINQKFE
jgi:hypothetical protein